MNIRHWPLTKVMQLPDYCFGRRWPVGVSISFTGIGAAWAKSIQVFPSTFVLWELMFWTQWPDFYATDVFFALGDKLPTTETEFNKLPRLLPRVGFAAGAPEFLSTVYAGVYLSRLRLPIQGNNRHLIIQVRGTSGKTTHLQSILTISGVPEIAPDWLVKKKK